MSHNEISYSTCSDEELCGLSPQFPSAEEELVRRYSRLVRACARPLFLAGGDSEDLIQEGMFGLVSAIRSYDSGRGASFRTYADTCIRNRLLSAIRTASSARHTPLNSSLSFYAPSLDSELSDSVPAPRREANPEELFISRERAAELEAALNSRLSAFEAKVLGLYFQGCSYAEIAARLNKQAKSVDNAVQRVRRKAADFFSGANS